MTADLAGQVRALALADALRRVAPERLGLADSISFGRRFAGDNPAAPGFDERVAAAVREVTGAPAADRQAAGLAAAAERRATGQWTSADLEQASPAEITAAYESGQLAALGTPAPRRRTDPMAGVRMPSAAQVRRWNAMPPWQRQRERAKWMARGREAGLSDAVRVAEPPAPREHARDPRANPTARELLDRATRRAQLTRDYAGEITADDVAIADPHVVSAWAESGKLTGLGVAPQRARR